MYRDELRFSLWCDFVERSFLEGEFVELISKRIVNAATSNPSIFKSAFLTSSAYADEKASLKGKEPKAIYEALAISDIKSAAKTMLPLYEKGDDGFISMEVDPFLCDDAEGTIEEGRRLFQTIGFPNVMIKVPATEAGFVAMEVLLREGINVNATLVFSASQTKGCLQAFEKANNYLKEHDVSAKMPQAVISIFVSRFDRKLDEHLKKIDFILSRVGIMNALKLYGMIAQAGLANVRALFASTGTKGDVLDEDYYIKELLCKNAINTAPLATIKAFISNAKMAPEVVVNKDEIDNFFASLLANNIDINSVCDELMNEGLRAFKEAFGEIMEALK